MRMLLASVVNRGSTASNYILIFPGAGILVTVVKFLSRGTLAFFRALELLAQISVARMKSAAFLRASTNVVSFYSAKENLKQSLLRPFKKEVYATSSFKLGINTAS